MSELLKQLNTLSAAEEFLHFFGVAYEPAVVHVNRLHILKRFYQYLHRAEGLDTSNEIEMFRRYREFLAQAYTDFTTSNAAQEKVFKVFQDTGGKQHVTVDSLRSSLSVRRAA